MAETGFIQKEKLNDFIKELSKDAVVYAPCLEGDTVLFKAFDAEKTVCLDRPANNPPKLAIFPQSETLFNFTYIKDTEDPKKMSVEIKANTEFPKAIIFGSRPCDANGFLIYDRVYIDTNSPDPYYKGRREKTTIVTLCCNAPSPGCFCVAVGGGPANNEGSDVLITELEKGYFVEAVTEKGKAVLNAPQVESGASYADEAHKKQLESEKLVKNPFGKDCQPEISMSLFDSDEFWEKYLSKCLSCGACTYLCPTCYCFNITDEQMLNNGERIRSWDGCMFPHFTLEGSGHNPRPTKFKRFRNRVGHKFVYYPEKYNGVIACCGCGRCIRYCPVSVDISEVVSYLRGSQPDASSGTKENAVTDTVKQEQK
ncbi:MAG TPA: 4Fe-4S dicluster domain-containing protein [Syntrophorhabdaceae bacterium]|nr:4Fe-4S dicluster domain-containing protein [Syntrophorhabdaceae bacterium]